MPKNSSRRMFLLLFCLSVILVAINISALIAAIPSIARSLHQPSGDVAAIVSFYYDFFNFVQKNFMMTFLTIGFLIGLLLILVSQMSVQRKEA